jgi:hypothetical protein
MITPGTAIPIPKGDRDEIAEILCMRHKALEREHKQLFADIKVWWEWYEAKPRSKTKDQPFKDASNLVVPLIQLMSDSLVNRLFGNVFTGGRRVWMAKTENEDLMPLTKDVVKFLNWAAADNDFDLQEPIMDWITEFIVIGSSVMALNWQVKQQNLFRKGPDGKAQPTRVTTGQGPLLEHVPREQILWNTDFTIGDAPEVHRTLFLSWSAVAAQAQVEDPKDSGWFTDEIEEIRGHSGIDGPAKTIRQSKREADSKDPSEAGDPSEPHEFLEIHIDWPLLQGSMRKKMEIIAPGEESPSTPLVPLVFLVHRKTQKIVRAYAEPYFLPYKPFFDGYYKKRPGRGHSVGLAKKLEHMQIAMTALLNQSIDARTRSNGVWARTSRRDLLSKPIDPRHPIHVPEGSTFEPFDLPTNVLQDTSIFNVVNIVAERLTGQADPNFGRESRSGGHPSPATSTMAMLQQSDKMVGTTREMLRRTISRIGEAIATLYQQFLTDDEGRVKRILGDADGERVTQFLFPTDPIIGLMEFDVVALNEIDNPQAEMQKHIQLIQMNTNYWMFLMQATQAMVQAQQMGVPGIGEFAKQSIVAQTKLHERLMEAGDIDDFEKFVAQLDQIGTQGQNDLRSASNGLGAVEPGAGPVRQPGMGGAQGANGSGAARAPGGNGIQ